MTTVIALTVLSLSLLGALIYQSRAHATQTQGLHAAHRQQIDALLDRIEAPSASQAAAFTRLMPPPPAVEPEEPFYVPFTDPDLQLSHLLQE